jgi:hypothetical protein
MKLYVLTAISVLGNVHKFELFDRAGAVDLLSSLTRQGWRAQVSVTETS